MTPQRYKRFQTVLQQKQLDLTLIMENVHKPHNFSAILRSCEAVGIYHVHAVTSSGVISQHHDTAAGAHKWLNVCSYSDINIPYQQLTTNRYQILAAGLNNNSQDFRQVDYTKPTAIVMGSELTGLSDTAIQGATKIINIPIHGLVESLNVSVAAAIILYEAQRQRQQARRYEHSDFTAEQQTKILFEWCYPEIARHYQKTGNAYPKLDQNGYIINNNDHL